MFSVMKGTGAYIKSLNGKSVKELVQMRTKLRKELYSLKMKHAIRGLKETHKITNIRKKIARVSTVLTRKIKENYGDNRW